MQIAKSLHAAVLVSDLERAEQFYAEILGLEKVNRPLKYPGAWYQIGDFQIHLIVAPQVGDTLVNEEKWGQNRHVALGIVDAIAAKQELEAAGFPVQMSASGRSALFVRDPDGNVIELTQI